MSIDHLSDTMDLGGSSPDRPFEQAISWQPAESPPTISPSRRLGFEARQSLSQTIRQTWRNYGFRVAAAELTYRLARRLMSLEIGQVLQLDLAAMRATQPPARELVCRFLSAAEVRAAASDPVYDLDGAMATRLQSGRDLCFGAYYDERLVNYSWYALGAIEPEHGFGTGLTIPLDAVYLYKAYTLPEYRGRQIHGAAIQQASRFFQQCGTRKLIAIVEFANWASLRSHEKLGCRPAGRLLRIGNKSWAWGLDELLRG